MQPPNVEALAVYQVKLTPELLDEGMEIKYEGIRLSRREKDEARAQLAEEISSAVLVELLVSNPDERFDIGDFCQPGSDQAPYNEAYLTEDGQTILSRFSVPDASVFRLVFFLHFFEPDKSLSTSYGEIALPPVQQMPAYLQSLVPYEPVD